MDTLEPIISGGRLLILENLKIPSPLSLTPLLIILAILELLQMCVDHFSEGVNAGTVLKLS